MVQLLMLSIFFQITVFDKKLADEFKSEVEFGRSNTKL